MRFRRQGIGLKSSGGGQLFAGDPFRAFRSGQGCLGGRQRLFVYKGTRIRIVAGWRQVDGSDGERLARGQPCRQSRGERLILERLLFVAADKEEGRRFKSSVVRACQSIFARVGLAGLAVGADIVRFEDRPQRIILGLPNGIVHVVMAPRTVERQAEKRLAGVLNRVVQPDIPVELEPVPHQKTGRAERIGIVRSQLVARQHFLDHAVIASVAIERLDDPVAPPPDMRLALAHFRAVAIPVAVAPYVHPMAAPTLAVGRRSE